MLLMLVSSLFPSMHLCISLLLLYHMRKQISGSLYYTWFHYLLSLNGTKITIKIIGTEITT